MEFKKIANSFGGEIRSESSVRLQLSFNSMVNAAKAADASYFSDKLH